VSLQTYSPLLFIPFGLASSPSLCKACCNSPFFSLEQLNCAHPAAGGGGIPPLWGEAGLVSVLFAGGTGLPCQLGKIFS